MRHYIKRRGYMAIESYNLRGGQLMPDMVYEMTVGVRVKFSISEKEIEEAIAYGVARGWLDKYYPDGDLIETAGRDDIDVIIEHVHMGRLKLGNIVKDAVDELRFWEIAASCDELDAYEEDN